MPLNMNLFILRVQRSDQRRLSQPQRLHLINTKWWVAVCSLFAYWQYCTPATGSCSSKLFLVKDCLYMYIRFWYTNMLHLGHSVWILGIFSEWIHPWGLSENWRACFLLSVEQNSNGRLHTEGGRALVSQSESFNSPGIIHGCSHFVCFNEGWILQHWNQGEED